MRQPDRKVEALAQSDYFARCTREELGAVAKTADIAEVDAGQLVAHPADRSRLLVVVLAGELTAVDSHGNARRVGPGDAWRGRGQRLVAAERARIVVLDAQRFAALARQIQLHEDDVPHVAVATRPNADARFRLHEAHLEVEPDRPLVVREHPQHHLRTAR